MVKYKIGVCCTFGAGSSLMLKMNLDTVFNKMGIEASTDVYDISSVKGVADTLDAIYTSSALILQVEESVAGKEVILIPVVNYFDLVALEELTRKYLLK